MLAPSDEMQCVISNRLQNSDSSGAGDRTRHERESGAPTCPTQNGDPSYARIYDNVIYDRKLALQRHFLAYRSSKAIRWE
jgi:hypothetical protein